MNEILANGSFMGTACCFLTPIILVYLYFYSKVQDEDAKNDDDE